MLLHSRQKRKVICSWVLLGCWAPSAERLEGAGEAMFGWLVSSGGGGGGDSEMYFWCVGYGEICCNTLLLVSRVVIIGK